MINSSEVWKDNDTWNSQEILWIRPLIAEHQNMPFKVKLYYDGNPVFLQRYEYNV